MPKKKSQLDLDYKPPKWKPGEAVAILYFCNGVAYKVGGYEIFDDEKCHSLPGGFVPIKLPPSKQAKIGELLIVKKGQKGRPVRRLEKEVFKLVDIPKHELKTFEELFGCSRGVTTVAGSYIQSEQEDLSFGLTSIMDETIENE